MKMVAQYLIIATSQHMILFSWPWEEIAHLVDSSDDERYIEMYLHRKFYDNVQILNVSKHSDLVYEIGSRVFLSPDTHCEVNLLSVGDFLFVFQKRI